MKKISCNNCGAEISAKTPPVPLPEVIRGGVKLLASGQKICGAVLDRVDGVYRGSQDGTLYGLNASPEEIDWDDFRAQNQCKHCGAITQRMFMLINKCCEHCGAYFDRVRVIREPVPGSGNEASNTPPTAAYCQQVLLKLREKQPDMVVEVPTDHWEPRFWSEVRTLEASLRVRLEFKTVYEAGRLVGVDDDPKRAWVKRLVG